MEKLRELRKEKQLTLIKIAEELSLPFETYRSYEIGRRQADYETLIKIADYFGVSTDYLLGHSENAHTHTIATPMGDTNTQDERELLEVYRSLSPELQETLWGLLATWTPARTINPKKKA